MGLDFTQFGQNGTNNMCVGFLRSMQWSDHFVGLKCFRIASRATETWTCFKEHLSQLIYIRCGNAISPDLRKHLCTALRGDIIYINTKSSVDYFKPFSSIGDTMQSRYFKLTIKRVKSEKVER